MPNKFLVVVVPIKAWAVGPNGVLTRNGGASTHIDGWNAGPSKGSCRQTKDPGWPDHLPGKGEVGWCRVINQPIPCGWLNCGDPPDQLPEPAPAERE